jgi:peroxiredoxin
LPKQIVARILEMNASAIANGFLLCVVALNAPAQSAGSGSEELLRKCNQTEGNTRTLAADIELTYQTDHGTKRNVGKVQLMKPNLARITLRGDYPVQILDSNGTTLFVLSNPKKYTQQKADPSGRNIDSPWFGLPFRYFFTQSLNPFGPEPDPTATTTYFGEQTIKGERFHVFLVTGQKPMPYAAKFYFGRDNLMHKSVVDFGVGPRHASFSATLTRLKTGQDFRAVQFHFSPPDSAKPDSSRISQMLAIGSLAPDFSLPTSSGQELDLTVARKGEKAVIVNFWFLGCPPCRKEFSDFETLYKELGSRGLNIVAVNMGDSLQSVAAYVRQENLTFPVLLGGSDGDNSVFQKYSVKTYPATYLLDSNGKILYRTAGAADITELRRVLGNLGLQTK